MPSKRRRQHEVRPPPAPAPRQAARSLPWLWIAIGVVALLITGLGIALLVVQRNPSATVRPTPASLRQPGPVNTCQAVPRFAAAAGYSTPSFATDDRTILGLKMFDPANPAQTYRHPSWASAGALGPLVADGQGNLYVAPVPRVNLADNPPALQNRIYKVDTNTGEMQLFIDLPAAAPPPRENSYGALGLTIDCETGMLYVTSVAGSDRTTERGRIYAVSLASGTVISQLDGVDAIGVGVYTTATGKRLYFGPARRSEIRSVALDDQGRFQGDERFEVTLNAPGASGIDRARRIVFTPQGEMRVNGRVFDYNLVANTFQPLLLYVYKYRATDDGWDLVNYTPNER